MSLPLFESAPQQPPLSDLLARDTFCARLAKYLLDRRGQWVDGLVLSKIGGYAGYRTRLSNLRKAPWWLDVRNRVRTVTNGERTFKVSEYKVL